MSLEAQLRPLEAQRDGFLNTDETLLGTNPLSTDSDNDDIPDNVEICGPVVAPATCTITDALNSDDGQPGGDSLIDALDTDKVSAPWSLPHLAATASAAALLPELHPRAPVR